MVESVSVDGGGVCVILVGHAEGLVLALRSKVLRRKQTRAAQLVEFANGDDAVARVRVRLSGGVREVRRSCDVEDVSMLTDKASPCIECGTHAKVKSPSSESPMEGKAPFAAELCCDPLILF